MAVAAAEDSVFAVRMGDYARRAAADSADRFLHGLAHLAVAALAFPRPEDLADDGYIGRITVNGVDAFVRQACRRLEERAEQAGREHRPGHRRPRTGGRLAGLRAAQRHRRHQGRPAAGRFDHRASSPRPSPSSSTPASSSAPATTSGGTYRTTARYQLQVRDMAGSAAMAELLELGVVPVSDGSATLLPPDGEPTTSTWPPTPACPSTPDPPPGRRARDRTATRTIHPTRARRHVRAVPDPPLLHRPRRRALRRHRAGPARSRRHRARTRPPPRPTSSRTSRPARRAVPAPAGVLFLENGGGKSVLLKLIFSVMLPGHRNTLGGASSGVLRKFLLADDCGHVALEWQHTLTGETRRRRQGQRMARPAGLQRPAEVRRGVVLLPARPRHEPGLAARRRVRRAAPRVPRAPPRPAAAAAP